MARRKPAKDVNIIGASMDMAFDRHIRKQGENSVKNKKRKKDRAMIDAAVEGIIKVCKGGTE